MPFSMTSRVVVLALAVSISLGACGGGGGSEPKATPTSIAITPNPSATLQSGGTLQFSAQVLDQNGTPMSGQTVTWASSNDTRATINTSSGLATGALVGLTTITATNGTLFSNPVTLTVTSGAAATLTKVTEIQPSMGAASSDVLRVNIKDAAGNNVVGATVNFAVSGGGSSLSSATATTDAAGNAEVTLTVGTTTTQVTTVTVTSGALTNVIYTTTTTAGPAAKLRITSPRIDMVDFVGNVAVTVTLTDAFDNPITPVAGVDYVSRNTAVATTFGSTVTGQARGQTIIVAQLASNTAVRDSMLLVVTVPAGPVLVANIVSFELTADAVSTVVISMDMRTSGELLGSTRVQVTWDPAVLTYVSDAEAASSVGATVNSSAAATGTFTLAVANSSGFAGRVELRRITFRANATVGRTGSLMLSTTELNGVSPNFTNLRPNTVAVSYPVRTR